MVIDGKLRFYSADSIGTEVQISQVCQMADPFDILYQVLADFLNVQLNLGVVRLRVQAFDFIFTDIQHFQFLFVLKKQKRYSQGSQAGRL